MPGPRTFPVKLKKRPVVDTEASVPIFNSIFGTFSDLRKPATTLRLKTLKILIFSLTTENSNWRSIGKFKPPSFLGKNLSSYNEIGIHSTPVS
jgi:hypothetical protein